MKGNSRQAIRRRVRTPTSGIAGVVGTARVNGGSPQPSTGLRASIHSHPRILAVLSANRKLPSGGISPVKRLVVTDDFQGETFPAAFQMSGQLTQRQFYRAPTSCYVRDQINAVC
jgi:hypothetical protein